MVTFTTTLMSKVSLRAAHYFHPCVVKRYQKTLVKHFYVLHVTPVQPKFGAKSTHDPKPAPPPKSIDLQKQTRRRFIIEICRDNVKPENKYG